MKHQHFSKLFLQCCKPTCYGDQLLKDEAQDETGYLSRLFYEVAFITNQISALSQLILI